MFFTITIYLAATVAAVAASGVAPGDEDPTCRGGGTPDFPPNCRILMDSYNYRDLLLPNNPQSVWQEVHDDSNRRDGISVSAIMSLLIHLIGPKVYWLTNKIASVVIA